MTKSTNAGKASIPRSVSKNGCDPFRHVNKKIVSRINRRCFRLWMRSNVLEAFESDLEEVEDNMVYLPQRFKQLPDVDCRWYQS